LHVKEDLFLGFKLPALFSKTVVSFAVRRDIACLVLSYPEQIVLLKHMAILFKGSPKNVACWSGRKYELSEELILTVGAHHG